MTMTHPKMIEIGYVAACLWEEAQRITIEEKDETDPFSILLCERREDIGTVEFRMEVTGLANACSVYWNTLSEDEQDDLGAFD